jgi:hypothetical protein
VVIKRARELGAGYAIVGAHFFQGMALGNEGRLGDALESLAEARRLAELNQEKYWLPRLPNTVAWLYRELGDPEKSHLLNLENVELAQEFKMQEGEANAHVNLIWESRRGPTIIFRRPRRSSNRMSGIGGATTSA